MSTMGSFFQTKCVSGTLVKSLRLIKSRFVSNFWKQGYYNQCPRMMAPFLCTIIIYYKYQTSTFYELKIMEDTSDSNSGFTT